MAEPGVDSGWRLGPAPCVRTSLVGLEVSVDGRSVSEILCFALMHVKLSSTSQQRGSAELSAVVEMFRIWAVQLGTTSHMWQVST